MKKLNSKYRVLFAGGGTGGHLYPAIAVADQLKKLKPETDILFIGTKSKIEGKVVPSMGYNFKSIWIKGFSRKFNLENILFPIKLLVSLIQSYLINLKFKPGVAIGSGGYVAGPAIFTASLVGAKIILMEQNSFPGITTRLLERFADEIHISFSETLKFLKRKDIVHITGNPVRRTLKLIDKKEALKKLELNENKQTLLVIGGSLGAASINKAIEKNLEKLKTNDIQIIWQTGTAYYSNYEKNNSESVKVFEFIDDMSVAFSASDLLLARAGATTIAEVTTLGIPALLVPSPNVAGNHQYFNAKSLADNDAALLIEDKDLEKFIENELTAIINDKNRLLELKKNALRLAKPEAAKEIALRAIKYLESK